MSKISKNLYRFVAVIITVCMLMPILSLNTYALSSKDDKHNSLNKDETIVISATNQTSFITSIYSGGWGSSWYDCPIYNDGLLNETLGDWILPAQIGFTITGQSEDAYMIDTYPYENIHFENVWISKKYLTLNFATAMAGIVNYSENAYGGISGAGFNLVGSTIQGQYVTILAKSGNYYYIEFNNATYLRMRGWVSVNSITNYGTHEPSDLSNIERRGEGKGELLYYAPGNYPYFSNIAVGLEYYIIDYEIINNQDYALVYFYLYSSQGVAGYIKI